MLFVNNMIFTYPAVKDTNSTVYHVNPDKMAPTWVFALFVYAYPTEYLGQLR